MRETANKVVDKIPATAFSYDPAFDEMTCPQGKRLVSTEAVHDNHRAYRASKFDCQACALKPTCCPTQPVRKIVRDIDEDAREAARALVGTEAFETSAKQRKKVEMLFAHLKGIVGMSRLRLRGMSGARDEMLLAALAQNLRRLAKQTGAPRAVPA